MPVRPNMPGGIEPGLCMHPNMFTHGHSSACLYTCQPACMLACILVTLLVCPEAGGGQATTAMLCHLWQITIWGWPLITIWGWPLTRGMLWRLSKMQMFSFINKNRLTFGDHKFIQVWSRDWKEDNSFVLKLQTKVLTFQWKYDDSTQKSANFVQSQSKFFRMFKIYLKGYSFPHFLGQCGIGVMPHQF